MKREKVTWPGAIIQKPGEGMPNYDNNKLRGNLYITIDVEFPRGSLPEETREGVCVCVGVGVCVWGGGGGVRVRVKLCDHTLRTPQ